MIKYKNKTLNKNFKINTLNNNRVVRKYLVNSNNYFNIITAVSGYMKEAELKTVKNVLNKKLKNIALIECIAYPYMNMTSKPLSVRMGKGKGRISFKKVALTKGKVLFKIRILDQQKSKLIYKTINSSLLFMSIPFLVLYNNY